MKNKMLWVGSVIILILSVICFVVFGVGTELIRAVTGEGNGISFGKYDGKDIVLAPGTDFANAVQNYTNYYQRQGAELDQSAYFYIYSYAFNSAVQMATYKDSVRKSGYKPSGKAISRIMLPYFLNADGKYDPKLYNQISNADKESLKSDISKQLVWQRFSDDMFGSSSKLGDYTFYGLKTSEKETEFLSAFGGEKRSFNTVSFSKADYPESEIKKFASENISLFDTYALSMITVKEESQAKKILTQLTNGEITFDDAVSEYSEKYYTDGNGKVKESFAYQVKENLANEEDFAKISALAKDSLSEIVKTNTGYSIYKCTGEKVASNIEDSATVDAVKKYITTNKQSMIEDYYTEKAKAFVASAKIDGFEKAATKAGAELVTVPAFSLNYGDVSLADKLDSSSAQAFANASSNKEFLEKAFSMKEKEISEPMLLGNYVTVFQLKEIQNAKADDGRAAKVLEEVSNYDQNSAQSTLLASSKIENNVSDVYFNKFMSR
ncbi:peptidylprolyl isomerase [uncultured Treponema sp.]|uniref:peptidylprolyl isomerase n=1 Tax=uncultured Treponema sp. TaxID=162155 RepID=UPI0025DEE161|nr:peptidylprolyl isomerase [uncultured Treponema sp.]